MLHTSNDLESCGFGERLGALWHVGSFPISLEGVLEKPAFSTNDCELRRAVLAASVNLTHRPPASGMVSKAGFIWQPTLGQV
jgi:hypothetical protein